MATTAPFSPVLHTPLCELLGIRYPIIKAGMGGGADTPELVAAVSSAGGLGLLSAVLTSPDQLRANIRAVRALTDRPFGVNVVVHPPETDKRGDIAATQAFLDRFRRELNLPLGTADLRPPLGNPEDQLAVAMEEQVPVINTMGDPTAVIAPAHDGGARVLAIVTTVAEAIEAVEAGADVVVAQGAEAGGLRGTFRLGPDGEAALIGTLALVPQVVDAVRVPVIAAGGIMDGRGIVAALALGAAGVLLGTRFSLARESGIFPGWRERAIAATEVDAVVNRVLTGRPARSIRNRLVEEHERAGIEPLPFPLQAAATVDVVRAAAQHNAADLFYLAAGQGLRLAKDGQGAAEIVAELVEEARRELTRLHTLVG